MASPLVSCGRYIHSVCEVEPSLRKSDSSIPQSRFKQAEVASVFSVKGSRWMEKTDQVRLSAISIVARNQRNLWAAMGSRGLPYCEYMPNPQPIPCPANSPFARLRRQHDA